MSKKGCRTLTVIGSPAPGGGGGSGGGSIGDVAPGSGFLMFGELAAMPGTTLGNSTFADWVYVDFVYFASETTITDLKVQTTSTSSGGTLTVALHPMTARGNFGTQDFVDTITVGTGAGTHTKTLSSAWVVPAGWYALVNWSAGAITNLLHKGAQTDAGVSGRFLSGEMQFFSGTTDEQEFRVLAYIQSGYGGSPDLTSVDFNDTANYIDTGTTNGKIRWWGVIPMVGLKVQ